jgi:hypothetical protein
MRPALVPEKLQDVSARPDDLSWQSRTQRDVCAWHITQRDNHEAVYGNCGGHLIHVGGYRERVSPQLLVP